MSDHDSTPEPPEFLPPDEGAAGDRGSQRRWLLPTVLIGCGCIGLPILLVLLGVAGISNTLMRLYRSTGSYQVYQLAAETLETDDAVVATLGPPIETGWTSRVKETYETQESGQVCMRFSVTGGDRSGSAYVEATRTQGTWQLHQLLVNVNGQPDPVTVDPLTAEEQPLCPNFDDPDAFDQPEVEEDDEIRPEAGTEI